MWLLYALLSAFFAGLTAILGKIGVKDTDSTLTTALRTCVVLVFAWLMVFVTGSQGGIGQIEPKSLVFLLLSGLATGASWLCYFKALQLGDVNKVVPIDKSSTVLTMLLAFLLLGESLTLVKGIGMALIAAGTFLMIQKQKTAAPDAGVNAVPKSGTWLLYAAGSAVFASLTAILSKIGIRDVESNLGTAIRTIVVLLMAWLMVFLLGKQREIRRVSGKSWLFIGLSGLATGASWLCYYRALQLGEASVVVPIDKLSILLTVGLSFVFLKEKLSGKAAAGLGVLTGGTLLLLVR